MTPGRLAKNVFERIFRPAALREARARIPAHDDRRFAALRQSKLLIEVARRVTDPADAMPPGAQPPVVLALYRDAIYWALVARGGAGAPPADLPALWSESGAQALAVAALGDAEAATLRRTLVDEYDPHALNVSSDDTAPARAFAEALVWDLEAPRRRVNWLLAQRWLGLAGVAIAVAVLAFGLRALTLGPNLAERKPFRTSSTWDGWANCVATSGCEDLMFHTNEDENPWVDIDLGAPKTIQRVEVNNRRDCCHDRVAPMIIELSTDRNTWTLVARRDDQFSSWTAKFRPKVARYVRLKVLKRTVMHLRSVAVR